MELNKNEIEALSKKEMNPNSVIKCPRCGNLLDIKTFETAKYIYCKTKDCINMTIRGI